MLPITFDPEKSYEVYKLTQRYLEDNPAIYEEIYELLWTYHALTDIIPQTTTNLWSGHYFPMLESWEEIQISYNLVCFGLYKQAMGSLRSGLELGLLSVYYNINDEGHKTVQKWLSSHDSKEANTPRAQEVWKIISANENIAEFQKSFDLRQRFFDLGYLHNYVHTKGNKYSNNLGQMKSNFQTFETKGLKLWSEALQEVLVLIATLHILKYPMSLVEYDYSKKFGIHIPSFPHLQQLPRERLKKMFQHNYFEKLELISRNDNETKSFIDWIESHPDLTEEDIEKQIVDADKSMIENQGIEDYKRQQLLLYQSESIEDLPDKIKNRVLMLEEWATENNVSAL